VPASLRSIEPACCRSRPATNRRSVVLPQPEGPSKATNSPAATSREMPSMAGEAWPKLRRTSRNRTAAPARALSGSVILQHRMHRHRRNLGPSAQAGQLDQHRHGFDRSAQLLHQLDAGLHRSAGGQQIVADQHALSLDHRVGMHFQRIGAIFERVAPRDFGMGQLAGLAD